MTKKALLGAFFKLLRKIIKSNDIALVCGNKTIFSSHAAGDDTFALFFEDPDRIKVEVVVYKE